MPVTSFTAVVNWQQLTWLPAAKVRAVAIRRRTEPISRAERCGPAGVEGDIICHDNEPLSAGGLAMLRNIVSVAACRGLRLFAVVSSLAFFNGAALAASTGCLIDDPKKICAALQWTPDSAQPSQQNGTKTYVRYDLTLTNATNQSTRFIQVQFSLQPATAFRSVTADSRASCTIAGATISCAIDKLEAGEPMPISATAETPAAETTLTNTVSYGWQGRTGVVDGAVAIDEQSGQSWQEPDQTVRLSTAKPASDPSQQTSPEQPIYGEIAIPPSGVGRNVFIRIVTDGPDRSPVCIGGIYLDPLADGGPFVCRDTGSPRRWVQVGADDSAEPMTLRVIEDASVVPAIQLPPTLLAPTGLPPFAVFARGEDSNAAFRAIDDACSSNAPPCLQNVVRYPTGDWTATLKLNSVDLGPAPPLLPLPGDLGIFGIVPPIGNFL